MQLNDRQDNYKIPRNQPREWENLPFESDRRAPNFAGVLVWGLFAAALLVVVLNLCGVLDWAPKL